jgi:hypothetical protein
MTALQDARGEPTTIHAMIASDRVEGTPVRRPNGEKVGEIKRVMIDKVSGNVAYAVLSFGGFFGGFLGLGERYHPLPWSALKYNPELSAYEIDIPAEQLRKAPSFSERDDFDWGDRRQETDLHTYYKVPPYWGI